MARCPTIGVRLMTDTPTWQYHQTHEQDFNAVCRDLDFFDAQGRIRRWNGPLFWEKFRSKGHTRAEFETCACRTAKTNQGAR